MSVTERLSRVSGDDERLIADLYKNGTSINELCVNFVLCRELVLLIIQRQL